MEVIKKANELEKSISEKRKLILKYNDIINSIKNSQNYKDKYLQSKTKDEHHKYLHRTSIFTRLFRLFKNKEFKTQTGGHLTHNVNLEFEETELMDDILLVMNKHIEKERILLGSMINRSK